MCIEMVVFWFRGCLFVCGEKEGVVMMVVMSLMSIFFVG